MIRVLVVDDHSLVRHGICLTLKVYPDIEVIVLTGHGTEKDKDVCMELGAFAFLHKPVDIQLLSQTLMQANEKVQGKKQRGQ